MFQEDIDTQKLLDARLKGLDELKADRKIFLYDTFAGMTKPTKYDKNFSDINAKSSFERLKKDQVVTNIRTVNLNGNN